MAGAAATQGAGFDIQVIVGSKSFAAGADWPGYITARLNEGIDASAEGVAKLAREHIENVVKYVEHFHGTNSWNGQLVNNSNRLQRRSGGTIDAFKAKAGYSAEGPGLNKVEGHIDVGMFGIHLDGGTVRATRSKYLTIPLPSACDMRGVPLKKSSRDWPDTFVIRSKRGNLLICHKVNGRVVPLYLLKSSVRIPARLKELPKVWDSYINRFEAALIQEIERCIDAIIW